MAPDYDHLTLMQKVEVFEHALEHTQGDDLAKILWVKSPSSEVRKHFFLSFFYILLINVCHGNTLEELFLPLKKRNEKKSHLF